MPRELPGVHQVVSHDCVVTGGLGLVAHELHDALGDALDRLGGDLGGGVTRPREPSTARHRRRGGSVLWGFGVIVSVRILASMILCLSSSGTAGFSLPS